MASVDDLTSGMAAIQLMTEDEVKAVPQAYEDGEAGFGALKSERGLFPLRSVKVSAKVSSLSSHITLDQTFLNAFDSPLEATYIFPLPSRAAVTSFRLEVKHRVVEGIIKERGEARREYTQAIQEGHRAAIAEEERAGVFTIRVGNIGAGEIASVRLTMAGPLPFNDGEATFRFPLLVAPRYIPGVPLGGKDVGSGQAVDTNETPDASRISPPTMVTLPGFQDPVQLSIEVEFDSASLPISNIRSSLHTVMITDIDMGGQESATSPPIAIRRLRLDPTEDRRLNRDFILRFNVSSPSLLTASLMLSDDQSSDSQEGTWQLTLIAPPGGATGVAKTPQDVAIVLDRSGSMSGWKMVAARSATARMVDTLTDADRFTVLAFDNSIVTPPGHSNQSLIPATDYNRQSAVNYLSKLEARGGTEMGVPLVRAADALQAPRAHAPGGFWPPRGHSAQVHDRVLILVTDGQVGNEDWIMGQLAPKLQGVRIFTLGIDQSVNEGFLARLAALTPGGASELVESQGRLEHAMERIHRLISNPALMDVQIDGPRGPGIEPILDATTHGKPGAVFEGIPAVISGRYRKTPAQPGANAAAPFVTVVAKTAAGENWNQAIAAQQTLNPALGALWARATIGELDDRYTIAATPSYYGRSQATPNPDKPDELRARILALSLRFSVLSRFSAFVAVDRAEKIESNGSHLVQVTQPVEAPGGWESMRSMRMMSFTAPGARRKELGRARVTPGECYVESGTEKSCGMSMNECYAGGSAQQESCRAPPGAPPMMPGMMPHFGGGWGGSSGGARSGRTLQSARKGGKSMRRGSSSAPGAEPKPSNPEAEREVVKVCLEIVRGMQSPGGGGESLVKTLVEKLKEVLARVGEQWQTGASFEVLRGAVKSLEATGRSDPGLLAQVQAALERIEQTLGSA